MCGGPCQLRPMGRYHFSFFWISALLKTPNTRRSDVWAIIDAMPSTVYRDSTL